jgi:hypothetical protein
LEKAGNNLPSSKGLRDEEARRREMEAGGREIILEVNDDMCINEREGQGGTAVHLNVILDVRSMGAASSLLGCWVLKKRNCTQSRATMSESLAAKQVR